MEEKIRLAVFGQKRLSREGGMKAAAWATGSMLIHLIWTSTVAAN